MPSIEKQQILDHLDQVFRSLVRRARCGPNRDEPEGQSNWDRAFPSRALTCFYLQTHAGMTPSSAVYCDVDGGEDEGIDGFHYDPVLHHLFLIQGKAGGDGGTDQPSLPECLRFFDGLERFLSGDIDRFEELNTAQKSQARAALADTSLHISLVVAHFGGDLDERRTMRAEQIVNRYNQSFSEPRMKFVNFDLRRAHGALMALSRSSEVNCRLKLHSYAKHTGQFGCYYGRILASDLKALHDDVTKRDSLYARNVRFYRGSNPVNERVRTTVLNEPENLFYLNNGVTALCKILVPTPETASRDDGTEGEFDVTGFVVVNGAQTIGTIAAHLPDGNTTAFVLLRIIIVGEQEADIGEKVAEASNFQTTVDSIDFLSVHPRHEQIATTLRQSGVTYHTKRAALLENFQGPTSFSLKEALEARVCSVGDPKLLQKLKSAPSELQEELRSKIESIFPDSLSARTLWREVQICRILDESLGSTRDWYHTSSDKAFFKHGGYFLKAILLLKFRELVNVEAISLTPEENAAARTKSDELLAAAFTAANSHFITDHDWNHHFRTQRTIRELKRVVLTALNAEFHS
ncbi:MAG: AIPR family protein [Verrucomicrobiota bacterium]